MNIPTYLQRSTPLRAIYRPGITRWLGRFSTFEKVIIANSIIIVLDTLAGWWITQSNLETYSYVVDTTFIVLAVVFGIFVNFLFLHVAFAPLRNLLVTIRAVERGDLEVRVSPSEHDTDVRVLAHAFNDMLDQLAYTRNEGAARVLRAQEEERRRLALELHDQTGQSLTALLLRVETIGQQLAGETSEASIQARHQAEQLSVLAQQTLTEIQTLSRQLRPPMLDDLGLSAALRWLSEDANQRLGITFRVVVDYVERLPSDVETALFRIAQESLTNAVRHGHATYAACLLRRSAQGISLLIADNGQGFNQTHRSSPQMDQNLPGGLGLAGMQARIRPLRGTLTVRSHPGGGCWIRTVVPLSDPLTGT